MWLDDPLTHSHLNVLSPDASGDEEYEKKVTCLESITMVIVLILLKSVSSLSTVVCAHTRERLRSDFHRAPRLDPRF